MQVTVKPGLCGAWAAATGRGAQDTRAKAELSANNSEPSPSWIRCKESFNFKMQGTLLIGRVLSRHLNYMKLCTWRGVCRLLLDFPCFFTFFF